MTPLQSFFSHSSCSSNRWKERAGRPSPRRSFGPDENSHRTSRGARSGNRLQLAWRAAVLLPLLHREVAERRQLVASLPQTLTTFGSPGTVFIDEATKALSASIRAATAEKASIRRFASARLSFGRVSIRFSLSRSQHYRMRFPPQICCGAAKHRAASRPPQAWGRSKVRESFTYRKTVSKSECPSTFLQSDEVLRLLVEPRGDVGRSELGLSATSRQRDMESTCGIPADRPLVANPCFAVL